MTGTGNGVLLAGVEGISIMDTVADVVVGLLPNHPNLGCFTLF